MAVQCSGNERAGWRYQPDSARAVTVALFSLGQQSVKRTAYDVITRPEMCLSFLPRPHRYFAAL